MLKKVGMVAAGSMAGLVALAPIASATECAPQHHDKGHSKHHGDHHGKKHVSKVDDHSKNKNAAKCEFTGGTGEANGGISGDSFAGNLLTQAPIGGAVTSLGSCSNILQDNLNGNTVLSNISILGGGLPA